MPVLCYNKPFGLSPIEGGIRLAGTVEIERGEDGTWLIRQDDAIIADRCAETLMIHGAAIAARNRAMEG